MSNTPSSPVVVRIQQSALIFVVLVLVLGALLLAANNIDPKASQRAGVNYVSWTSSNGLRSTSNGLISLEIPKGWEPLASGLTYQFQSPDDQNTLIKIGLLRADQVPLISASSNTRPDQLATLIEAQLKKQSPTAGIITPVTIGTLQGALLHHVLSYNNPNDNTTTNIDTNIYILALDPTHVVFILGQYPSDSSATNQPIVDHVVNSFHAQVSDASAAIDAAIQAAATAAATVQATQLAPGPATVQATMQAATQLATQAATARPTNTATATLTNTPKPTLTNTAKPTNTPVPPTNTATATLTSTPKPTNTATATLTNTPKPTNTPLPTATNTATATALPSHTPTHIPTATPGVVTVEF